MSRKRIAILQSNYIPWKGYFDLIAAVDEFIFYDDVQFTKNDWRNRNKIKTQNGLAWLSVPVGQNIKRLIKEVRLGDARWQEKHWSTLCHNYKRAACFESIATRLEPLYLNGNYQTLSELNRTLVEFICKELGITTRLSWSWDYKLEGGKSERLVNLCEQTGASEYVSGPSAKNYLDEAAFHERSIAVTYFDYNGYPEYPQLWSGFEHGVSVLDLLFNCGPASPKYLKYASMR